MCNLWVILESLGALYELGIYGIDYLAYRDACKASLAVTRDKNKLVEALFNSFGSK